MSNLTPVEMTGFTLSPDDVLELMPDITQDEMEAVAELVTDYLMEEWANCLSYAIDMVKGDRPTASQK